MANTNAVVSEGIAALGRLIPIALRVQDKAVASLTFCWRGTMRRKTEDGTPRTCGRSTAPSLRTLSLRLSCYAQFEDIPAILDFNARSSGSGNCGRHP